MRRALLLLGPLGLPKSSLLPQSAQVLPLYPQVLPLYPQVLLLQPHILPPSSFLPIIIPSSYEHALRHEEGSFITSTGALCVSSGAKTGRSPADKRIVDEPQGWWAFTNEVWWGKVNIKLDDESFLINRERAVDYLNTLKRIYVVDAYAGWDPKYRIKVRVITSRAYHALFMQNMLVRILLPE